MYAKVEDVVKLKLSERCGKKTLIVSRLKILIPEFMSGIFFVATNSTKNLRILLKKTLKETQYKNSLFFVQSPYQNLLNIPDKVLEILQ